MNRRRSLVLGMLSRHSSRVVWVIMQSLSADLVVNGSFANDAAWTKGAGWTIGSGVASHAAGAASSLYQSFEPPNAAFYETLFTITVLTAGSLRAFAGSNSINTLRTAIGRAREVVRYIAPNALGLAATSDAVGSADSLVIKAVTLNPQLTAPSADMRLDLCYTLPVSPDTGTQVWLLPRISDFSAGNYWLGLLEYTGSQWNITLFTVASHSRTSRIAATNIGVTNGIRVNMNGGSISLYTTADSFATAPTQRGTTITNSTYSTATGVNAIYTSDFADPVTITYAPAA